MYWTDLGYKSKEEFIGATKASLDSNVNFAQIFVDKINPEFSIDNFSEVQHQGLAPREDWDQLIIYHRNDYISLSMLTKDIGSEKTKSFWIKLKECDLLMGRVMPNLYRVFLDLCDIRRPNMASGYYEKCKAEWTLPDNFDPKNPFPDIVYPEGVLD